MKNYILTNPAHETVGIVINGYAQLLNDYMWAKHDVIASHIPADANVCSITFVYSTYLDDAVAHPNMFAPTVTFDAEASIPFADDLIPFLRLPEVTDRLRISERTVHNWIQRGILHPFRMAARTDWCFPAGEIARLLKR
jgi:hypothetical protein